MDVVAVDLANGQVKEAIALLEQVVATRKRVLAEDDPDRLTSQHELARAYRANGQVKEAIALSWEMGSTPARDLRAFVLVEAEEAAPTAYEILTPVACEAPAPEPTEAVEVEDIWRRLGSKKDKKKKKGKGKGAPEPDSPLTEASS